MTNTQLRRCLIHLFRQFPRNWLGEDEQALNKEICRRRDENLNSVLHISLCFKIPLNTNTRVLHSPEYQTEMSVSAPTQEGLTFWQYMLAGSIAGSAEHMAMFPVDTVKTRIRPVGGSWTVRQAVGSILKVEGPCGIYRGIRAMGIGAGPAHAVYFSVYELCKEGLISIGNGNGNSPFGHAVSGVCATVASDAVLTPMDVVKQRLQLRRSPYKGVGECVRRVMVEEGIGALYASYRTTVLMNAPYTAAHFAIYEGVKRGLLKDKDEGLVVHATAGAPTGSLAGLLTTPLDVVKTQLQCQGVCGCDRLSNSSIGYVLGHVVKKDGYRGLMRGWIPRMLFHAPAAAICWSTYEASKAFFQQLHH